METVDGIVPPPAGATVHPDPTEELEFVWLTAAGENPRAVTRSHGPPGTAFADWFASELAGANVVPVDPPLELPELNPPRAKNTTTITTTTTATNTGQNRAMRERRAGGTIDPEPEGGSAWSDGSVGRDGDGRTSSGMVKAISGARGRVFYLSTEVDETSKAPPAERAHVVMEKAAIVAELGESTLLLPAAVGRALRANDRVKYLFALLQSARIKADRPTTELPSLSAEREQAGEPDARLDSVVRESRGGGPDRYAIPLSSTILAKAFAAVEEMIVPVATALPEEAARFQERFDRIRSTVAAPEGEVLRGATIDVLTSGDRSRGDSLHLLVLDLHRSILAIQATITTEAVEGASTYGLREGDRPLVRAFMVGVHRTAPLKFDHPGLGTTATRIGERLVIQNDIGETDAHVVVISVENGEVSIAYSDVHANRLEFFEDLLRTAGFAWEETATRTASRALEKEDYFLVVGRCHPPSPADLETTLTTVGSKVVFLIDWNRARKELRAFMRNSDAVSLLKWSASEEVGHRAFLLLGGGALILEAIDLAPKGQLHYRERLSEVLGTTRTRQYFQWVFRTAGHGLASGESRVLLRDEVKAELLRYFHTLDEDLLGMCIEQASLLVELATSVEDSLSALAEGAGPDLAERGATRAKGWEKSADEIVVRVRTITRRSDSPDLFRDLVGTVDDAVDALEDAAFSLKLATEHVRTKAVFTELVGIARIATEASQEFLKSIHTIGLLGPASREEDMQDFLASADRVASLEESCDVALRTARQRIWSGGVDFRECALALEVAGHLEQSTNHLKRAAYTIKDDVFERLNRGAFRFNVD